MEYLIDGDFDGRSVKDLMQHSRISHGAITRLKRLERGITVNGKRVTVRKILKKGDILCLATEDLPEDENAHLIPEKMELDILYEDENMLAVNKPPYMPAHISLGHRTGTLANGVAYYFSSRGIPFVFRAVNRLDRDTSGVILIAKNRLSAARLSKLMQTGKIRKKYIAVLNGELSPSEGEIRKPIRRKPDSIMLREVCEISDDGAKNALTAYKVLGVGGGVTLVEAEPITGRTHQLRVHFASEGCPIVGDGFYGSAENAPTWADKAICRQALHAASLHIDFGDRVLEITAPLCDDMAALVKHINLSEKI